MASPVSLLQGTLDVLILKALIWGPRHGYAVARFLEDATGHELQIEEGSLYPALYRMEGKGWISAEWGTSELGRKVKLYSLSPAGRKRLREQMSEWTRFSSLVDRVLALS
ncbi:MAG: PadR family transcriptional regulator [Gemmatimonadales bacterium]